MSKEIKPLTSAEKSIIIRHVCDKVRDGIMTFDEGVDYFIEHDPTSRMSGRIEYVDFLWSLLGRPPDEVLKKWEDQGKAQREISGQVEKTA